MTGNADSFCQSIDFHKVGGDDYTKTWSSPVCQEEQLLSLIGLFLSDLSLNRKSQKDHTPLTRYNK